MLEYAVVDGDKVTGSRWFAEAPNPAGIRKVGGSLFVETADGARVAIGEGDLPRVLQPHRVQRVPRVDPASGALIAREAEGGQHEIVDDLYVDGALVDALPADAIVGVVKAEGGLPVLRPFVDIKPPLAEGERHGAPTIIVCDDRVDRIYPVEIIPPPRRIPPREFRARFTPRETTLLYEAAQVTPALRMWIDDVLAMESVDLDDAKVEADVNGLVRAGILTAERATVILS